MSKEPKNLNLLADEELMVFYQNGSTHAFDLLYKRHSSRVFEFLRRRTNPQNAGDLLQESFLKLHKARHQYSGKYPFLPWLFTITRNVLYDHARLKETKLSRNSVSEVEELADHEKVDTGADLQPFLVALPEAQRRAVELRYLQDWSFERIAAEMQTTPINIRQIVNRGLKKIRSNFGGNEK